MKGIGYLSRVGVSLEAASFPSVDRSVSPEFR